MRHARALRTSMNVPRHSKELSEIAGSIVARCAPAAQRRIGRFPRQHDLMPLVFLPRHVKHVGQLPFSRHIPVPVISIEPIDIDQPDGYRFFISPFLRVLLLQTSCQENATRFLMKQFHTGSIGTNSAKSKQTSSQLEAHDRLPDSAVRCTQDKQLSSFKSWRVEAVCIFVSRGADPHWGVSLNSSLAVGHFQRIGSRKVNLAG